MAQIQTANTPQVELIRIDNIASRLVLYEFRVQGSTAADRGVDVLFIHGLTGDPIKTWGDWPQQLASELSDRATVWSLGYPSPLFERPLGTTQEEFASEGRKALAELVHAGLGKKPMVFVTHSLGGLLAKSMIAEAAKTAPGSSEYLLFANTHAVIFAGTPHAGSGQAKWRLLVPAVVNYAAKGATLLIAAAVAGLAIPLLSVSLFGRTWEMTLAALIVALSVPILVLAAKSLTLPGRHVVMLDPSNPALASLTRQFRRAQFERKFAVDSFYEQKRLWGLFLVVPRWSADPGITESDPTPIPADHIGICKDANAELLRRAIHKQVKDASRGKEAAVFRERLKRLLKQPEEHVAFGVLFEGKEGDRGKQEIVFRTFVRKCLAKGEFVPTGPELDLAIRSNYHDDELVWSLWQELQVAGVLARARATMGRTLRELASREIQKDFSSTQAPGKRTLIPFYRLLRTIEHISSGDLPDPGYGGKSDRDLLLETVEEASEKLQQAAAEGWDTNGQTRRLVLRLGCMARVVHVAQDYVGKGKYKEQGEELAALLHQRKQVFDQALATLEKRLPPA
ncbi:hypothetical protein SBA3_1650011 [Candidatus Sulfopaludibacter sp. SbA3]|nr:hypothetical protein SBA3_1650011 [Candidatus Sulfopaludibacter sp. SbA3]